MDSKERDLSFKEKTIMDHVEAYCKVVPIVVWMPILLKPQNPVKDKCQLTFPRFTFVPNQRTLLYEQILSTAPQLC